MAGPAPLIDRLEDEYLPRLIAVLAGMYAKLQTLALERLRAQAVEMVSVVAAGPIRVEGAPLISSDDWVALLGGDELVDVMGDVIVESSTKAALVIGTNVSDTTVRQVLAEHVAEFEAWGPALQSSVTQLVGEAASLNMTLDQVAERLSQDGPFSLASARAVARSELCLVGDTRITGARVEAGFDRWYEGSVVEVLTKSGRKLTGTPNHPVLCDTGWRPLGELTEGDRLVCHRAEVGDLVHRSQVERRPPTIAQIVDSLAAVGVTERKRGERDDFHGDGFDSDVYVQHADGLLLVGDLPPSLQGGREFPFAPADVALARLHGPCSLLGGSHLVDVLLGSGHAPKRDACLSQNASHQPLADPRLSRQLFDAYTDCVAVDEGCWVNVLASVMDLTASGEEKASGLPECPRDSGFGDDSVDHLAVASDGFGDHSPAEAGLVELDDVVSLRWRDGFAGHVYTLSTADGLFGAEGIITMNCAAANGGMFAGWRAAGVLTKTWKATPDGRTRPAHRRADGQVQPLEIDFLIAGASARYPGDVRLPISLRAGCRCYMGRSKGEATDLDELTKEDMLGLAKELGIVGRHEMSKAQLRDALDRYRKGLLGVRLEKLSRNQLLERAKLQAIKGRHRMNKADLLRAIRGENPVQRGPDGQPQRDAKASRETEDLFRNDTGYVSRAELIEDQRRARRKATAAARLAEGATGEPSGPGEADEREAARKRLFTENGGDDKGYVGSVFSGAKLHWTTDPDENPQGYEVMARVRLDRRLGFEDANVVPASHADAAEVARRAQDAFAKETTVKVPVKGPSAFKAMSAYNVPVGPALSEHDQDLVDRLSEIPSNRLGIDDQAAARARIEAVWRSIEDGSADADRATLAKVIDDHPLDRDVKAWRVVTVERGSALEDQLLHLSRHDVLTEASFSAATLRKSEAMTDLAVGMNEAPVMFEIRMPEGARAYLAAQHTQEEGNQFTHPVNEGVYMPPGTKMRVVTAGSMEDGVLHYVVELVPDRVSRTAAEATLTAPTGMDPRFLTWGDKGAELAAAVDGRPRLVALSDENAPAAYNTRVGPYSLNVADASIEHREGGRTVDTTVAIRSGDVEIGTVRVSTDQMFSPDGVDRVTSAYIDSLSIDPSRRGEGVATAVLNDLESYWTVNGVDEVRTVARGAGGFGLARRGYDFDPSDPAADRLGSYLASRLTQSVPSPLRPMLHDIARGKPTDLRTEDAKTALAAAGWTGQQLRDVATMQVRLRDDDPFDSGYPTPHEVAMVGYRTGSKEWAGKEAMTGATWPAVKQLVGVHCGLVASAGSASCGISARRQVEDRIAKLLADGPEQPALTTPDRNKDLLAFNTDQMHRWENELADEGRAGEWVPVREVVRPWKENRLTDEQDARYLQTMRHVDTRQLQVVSVDPRRLVPIQNEVDPVAVLKVLERGVGLTVTPDGDGDVKVVKAGDQYLLIDGHHRAAAAVLQGATTMQVRVYDAENLPEIVRLRDELETARRAGPEVGDTIGDASVEVTLAATSTVIEPKVKTVAEGGALKEVRLALETLGVFDRSSGVGSVESTEAIGPTKSALHYLLADAEDAMHRIARAAGLDTPVGATTTWDAARAPASVADLIADVEQVRGVLVELKRAADRQGVRLQGIDATINRLDKAARALGVREGEADAPEDQLAAALHDQAEEQAQAERAKNKPLEGATLGDDLIEAIGMPPRDLLAYTEGPVVDAVNGTLRGLDLRSFEGSGMMGVSGAAYDEVRQQHGVDTKAGVQAFVGQMDAAMRPLPSSIRVYRGVDAASIGFDGAEDSIGRLVGSTVRLSDRGYLSTSNDREFAGTYGPITLDMTVPAGMKALVFPATGNTAPEIVLARDSSLEATAWDAATRTLSVRVVAQAEHSVSRAMSDPPPIDAAPDDAPARRLAEVQKQTSNVRAAELAKTLGPSFSRVSAAKDGSWLSVYMKDGSRYDIEVMPDGSIRSRWAPSKGSPSPASQAAIDGWLGVERDAEPDPPTLRSLLGNGRTDEAVRVLQDGLAVAGDDWKVVVDVHGLEGGVIEVLGHIVDADGEEIGQMSRGVYVENGKVIVENDQLMLTEDMQGKGIGGSIIAGQMKFWRSLGVDVIRVHAVEVGGYTWASTGFGWTRKGTRAFRDAAKLSERVLQAARDAHDAKAIAAASVYVERATKAENYDELPTPYELSQVGRESGASSWPGKVGMLYSTWKGEIDLTDLGRGLVASGTTPSDDEMEQQAAAMTAPAEPGGVAPDQPRFERVIPVPELVRLRDDTPLPKVERAVRNAEVGEVHDQWVARHLPDASFAPEGKIEGYSMWYLDLDGNGVQQADFARMLVARGLL